MWNIQLLTEVGETGEQTLLSFRLIKKYIHIWQQIYLIQKEDTCLLSEC